MNMTRRSTIRGWLAPTLAVGVWVGCGPGVSEHPLGASNGSSGVGGLATDSAGGGAHMAEANGGGGSPEISNGGSEAGSGTLSAGAGGHVDGGKHTGGNSGAAGDDTNALGGDAGHAGRRAEAGANSASGPDAGGDGGDHGDSNDSGGDGGNGGDRGANGGNSADGGNSGDDGNGGDAGKGDLGAEPPRRCSPDAPFGTPVRVPGLPGRGVRLRLNPDETLGYYAFKSDTKQYDILVAQRETRAVPFGEGVPLAINDESWDFSPTVSGDGSVLYFEGLRADFWAIYRSVWDAKTARYAAIELAPGFREAADSHFDSGPYVIPSGRAIYFQTNRTGSHKLATAEWDGSAFGNVVILNFGALGTQSFPVASADELTLYFAVNNASNDAATHTDLWMAIRSSRSSSFALRELAELNTREHEVPSFISEDGCRLYFDRVTRMPFGWGATGENAYVAERQPDH